MTRPAVIGRLIVVLAAVLVLAGLASAGRPKSGSPCQGTVTKVVGNTVWVRCPDDNWPFQAVQVWIDGKRSTPAALAKKGAVRVTVYWHEQKGARGNRLIADKILYPAQR